MRRLLPVFLPVVLVLAACGQSAAPASSISPSSSSPAAGGGQAAASGQVAGGMTQTSEGGQVTVVATWAGPSAGATFDLKLDTHSVDLDALDLSTATLRNDRGDTLTARPWSAPKGGHHREGSLSFDGDSAAFLAGAKWIELVLPGIGDTPERVLRWTIGGQP